MKMQKAKIILDLPMYASSTEALKLGNSRRLVKEVSITVVDYLFIVLLLMCILNRASPKNSLEI